MNCTLKSLVYMIVIIRHQKFYSTFYVPFTCTFMYILTNLMNAKKLTWESGSLVGVEAQEEHRNFPVLLMLPVKFVVLKHTKQDFSPC